MKKKFILKDLDCIDGASKIESAINSLDDIKNANVNFMNKTLFVEIDDGKDLNLLKNNIEDIIKKFEPHVKLIDISNNNEEHSHDHDHDHSHDHSDENMKNKAILLCISGILLVVAYWLYSKNIYNLLSIILFALSYLIAGYKTLLSSIRNILKGQIFDENFLVALATIGALLIGEYPEAISVMLFYEVGELFQSYAVGKSRKSISALMDIRPDFANLKKDNKIVTVSPQEVVIDDIIIVKPGEKIPLDGIVVDGTSLLDTTSLTGESVPREVTIDNPVLSGCINLNGTISVKVTKTFGESTASKILDLVENATNKKTDTENFITTFARYYTPIVVITAAVLAFVPPIIIESATFKDWIYRALTFLVISCPCALVLSIPLTFFAGIGGASKCGVLVKGSNYLESLAKTEIVVFDKTGTLTKGVFKVTEINPTFLSKDELLELTSYAESFSNHPISISIRKAFDKDIDNSRIKKQEEIAGHGIRAIIDNKEVLVGNYKLMKKYNIPYFEGDIVGTVVHVAIDNKYAGYIVIADEIKEDSKNAISKLKKIGVKKTVMLTGDSKSVGESVAKDLNIDEVYTELLPEDKVVNVEKLLNNKSTKKKLAFVGDGINDAPVLARADIGIAMGGVGSDAAIEAADVVIMTDQPSKIPTAISVSRKTLRIATQNIYFSIIVKVLVLILGAFGFASMWEAVFADVGVSIIAVLNSIRCMNVKNIK